MNDDDSSHRKIAFIYFHSVNIKGKWTHLAEKHSQPGAKIDAIFRLS